MFLRKPNMFLQKVMILLFILFFVSSGFPNSKGNNQFSNQITKPLRTCCKECGKENCTCCSRHEEKKTSHSDDCACRVSKDMAERPLSIPENMRLQNYYVFQTIVTLSADPISKNLSQSNLSSSTGDYIFLKAIYSTVIRI